MFKRRPLLYLDATLENYYLFFFPDTNPAFSYSYTWSGKCMANTNTICKAVGLDLHYPAALQNVRLRYESHRDTLSELPIVNVLNRSAPYVWLLLFLAIALLWKKDISLLFITVLPLLASLAVTLLGPCNGTYFRYVFLYAAVLPFVLVIVLCNLGQKN